MKVLGFASFTNQNSNTGDVGRNRRCVGCECQLATARIRARHAVVRIARSTALLGAGAAAESANVPSSSTACKDTGAGQQGTWHACGQRSRHSHLENQHSTGPVRPLPSPCIMVPQDIPIRGCCLRESCLPLFSKLHSLASPQRWQSSSACVCHRKLEYYLASCCIPHSRATDECSRPDHGADQAVGASLCGCQRRPPAFTHSAHGFERRASCRGVGHPPFSVPGTEFRAEVTHRSSLHLPAAQRQQILSHEADKKAIPYAHSPCKRRAQIGAGSFRDGAAAATESNDAFEG